MTMGEIEKKCIGCGTIIKVTSNAKKYCSECAKKKEQLRKRNDGVPRAARKNKETYAFWLNNVKDKPVADLIVEHGCLISKQRINIQDRTKLAIIKEQLYNLREQGNPDAILALENSLWLTSEYEVLGKLEHYNAKKGKKGIIRTRFGRIGNFERDDILAKGVLDEYRKGLPYWHREVQIRAIEINQRSLINYHEMLKGRPDLYRRYKWFVYKRPHMEEIRFRPTIRLLQEDESMQPDNDSHKLVMSQMRQVIYEKVQQYYNDPELQKLPPTERLQVCIDDIFEQIATRLNCKWDTAFNIFIWDAILFNFHVEKEVQKQKVTV